MKTFKQFNAQQRVQNHVNTFRDYVSKELGISHLPEVKLINDKADALVNTSFGKYHPDEKYIEVNIADRHIADILRTLAHELVHHKQNEEGKLHREAGETGSDFENEANSKAGVFMRNYGKNNPGIYEEVVK
jgi:hypothetical protein